MEQFVRNNWTEGNPQRISGYCPLDVGSAVIARARLLKNLRSFFRRYDRRWIAGLHSGAGWSQLEPGFRYKM